MSTISKRLSAWAATIAALLLIPLVLTIRSGGVEGASLHWSVFDFIFAGTLLFGSGLTYELIRRQSSSASYRIGAGIAVVTGLLLIWINGAVGIIGSEDNPANLLYGAVFVVGFFDTIVSRLEPWGMSRTLIATAVVQALVPVTAFLIWKPDFSAGVVQMFVLNAFFVLLWVIAALFFRHAAANEKLASF
ncbi:MAG: hypothetical protein JWN18_363 [Parcubacteria group bacterium]|nr:hypothetical protein [Parcubacteria group bacterium]